MLDLCRLTFCDASSFTFRMTSSWTGFSVICFHLKTPMRSSHSCSEQRSSYHTRREHGIRIVCSSPRQGFRPSYRWTSIPGRLKARLCPKGDGSQTTEAAFATTSKEPRFSFQFSSSTEMVALDFGSQTSSKAAIQISAIEMDRHHWGGEQRLIFVSV